MDIKINTILSKANLTAVAIGAVVGIIVNFASYFLFITTWVEKDIRENVQSKLRPYEIMLQAQALLRNGEPDVSLELIQPNLEILERQDIESRKEYDLAGTAGDSSLADTILEAARLSAEPRRYTRLIVRIEKMHETGELSTYGWHLAMFGWYYQRIGDLKKADEYFSKAIGALEAQPLLTEAAHAHWGATVIALTQGDVPRALTHFRSSAKQNPEAYEPETFVKRLKVLLTERGYDHLRDHASFQAALPAFVSGVEKLRAES